MLANEGACFQTQVREAEVSGRAIHTVNDEAPRFPILRGNREESYSSAYFFRGVRVELQQVRQETVVTSRRHASADSMAIEE